GREARGVVAPDEAAGLREELAGKLSGLVDEATGETAILKVYDSAAIYRGPYADAAPDLVIGYAAGFRAAWSAATGRVSKTVFEDNNKCWSGDHCVDPGTVPGVLFCNRKLTADDPGIEDLAPTVLRMFGVPAPIWMEGRALTNAAVVGVC